MGKHGVLEKQPESSAVGAERCGETSPSQDCGSLRGQPQSCLRWISLCSPLDHYLYFSVFSFVCLFQVVIGPPRQ